MHGSALKIKGACSPRVRSVRRVGPTLSRVADTGGASEKVRELDVCLTCLTCLTKSEINREKESG